MRRNKLSALINVGLIAVLAGTIFATSHVSAGASTPIPAFSAYGGITTAGFDLSKVDLSTEVFDETGDFDTTNDRFVAPCDGIYHFDGRGSLKFPGTGTHIATYLFKNGTFITEGVQAGGNNGGVNSTSTVVSATIKLNAGDYIELFIARGTGTGQATGTMSGFLVNNLGT